MQHGGHDCSALLCRSLMVLVVYRDCQLSQCFALRVFDVFAQVSTHIYMFGIGFIGCCKRLFACYMFYVGFKTALREVVRCP